MENFFLRIRNRSRDGTVAGCEALGTAVRQSLQTLAAVRCDDDLRAKVHEEIGREPVIVFVVVHNEHPGAM